MKTKLTYVLIAFLLSLSACVTSTNLSSSITEAYIKNQVETHREGEQSSIRTFSICNGPTLNGLAIEMTGYKYGSMKNLVIAAGEAAPVPARGKPSSPHGKITFIEISVQQAQNLLDNYKAIAAKIKAERPGNFETVYYDYTVSEHMFISYSRTQGTFDQQAATYMHLWVKGVKYTLMADRVIGNIEAFVRY